MQENAQIVQRFIWTCQSISYLFRHVLVLVMMPRPHVELQDVHLDHSLYSCSVPLCAKGLDWCTVDEPLWWSGFWETGEEPWKNKEKKLRKKIYFFLLVVFNLLCFSFLENVRNQVKHSDRPEYNIKLRSEIFYALIFLQIWIYVCLL